VIHNLSNITRQNSPVIKRNSERITTFHFTDRTTMQLS